MQGFKQKKQSVPAQVTCFMLTKCLLYAYFMLFPIFLSKLPKKAPKNLGLPPSCLRDASEMPPRCPRYLSCNPLKMWEL